MKYSTKLSDTVHVMVLIAINQEKSLSSASIAENVHTNPGFVRQLMLKLKKAGLMTSVAAVSYTHLDVYKRQSNCFIQFLRKRKVLNWFYHIIHCINFISTYCILNLSLIHI